MKYYTAKQFAIFRLIFGLYLTWHFATLIPYAPELFGASGIIPDVKLNPTAEAYQSLPTYRYLKGIFSEVIFESDTSVKVLLTALTLLSTCFAVGLNRRICSFLLWCGWIYLFNRNNLIANPGLPYVGWLLLACTFVPPGEGYNVFRPTRPLYRRWEMPSYIYYGAWFLMALGYTISGIDKIKSPSWIDGSAMNHVLSSMLARDYWMTNLFLNSPDIVLKLMTWGSLAAEITFLPLGVFDRVQKWYWLMFIAFHVGILMLINFTDLTLGVLMIHLFTFNSKWLNEFPLNLMSSRVKTD